jgi:hypothetical protein
VKISCFEYNTQTYTYYEQDEKGLRITGHGFVPIGVVWPCADVNGPGVGLGAPPEGLALGGALLLFVGLTAGSIYLTYWLINKAAS